MKRGPAQMGAGPLRYSIAILLLVLLLPSLFVLLLVLLGLHVSKHFLHLLHALGDLGGEAAGNGVDPGVQDGLGIVSHKGHTVDKGLGVHLVHGIPVVVDLGAAPGHILTEGAGRHAGVGKAGGVTGVHPHLPLEGPALHFGVGLGIIVGGLAGAGAEQVSGQRSTQHINVDVVNDLIQLVLVHLAVLLGAHKADLLAAAPQETDGTLGRIGLEVVHSLQQGDTARAVVPAAQGINDGVEVSGEDQHLLGSLGAGDLGDDVPGGPLAGGLVQLQSQLLPLVIAYQILHVPHVDSHPGPAWG